MQDIFESLFLKILNMSLTASYIIAAVLIVRLLLKRAPKKYSYALWAVAGFRLVCPVSFKSVISIFSLRPFALQVEETASSAGAAATQIVHIPENIEFMAQPEIYTGLEAVNAVVNDSLPAATPMYSVNPIQIWIFFGMLLWCLGIAVLLCLSLVSLIKLRRSLRTATLLEGNVWQSENVRSPFIVGLFRPKIYIPYGLSDRQLAYVLAHERSHIKRLDHVVKTLAFLILCLHWFNPLVWLAFYLMGRDMELSCDEKVLGSIGEREDYSETLLSFASPRRFPTPTPLAFGESSVSQRIKNALKWRRPKMWVSIVSLIACLGVIAACAANPREERTELWGDWVSVDYDYLSPLSSSMYIDGDNGRLYRITEEQGLTVLSHFNPDFEVYEDYDAIWGWQDFPYTDDEWAEMITLYSASFPAPISEMYEEILYQPLIDKTFYAVSSTDAPTTENFLLLLDGDLKLVYSTVEKNGKQMIWSIVSLERVEKLGTATFAYEPEKTSSEPGLEIRFPDDCQVNYQSYNGSIAVYNAEGERFAEGENVDGNGLCVGNIPAGGKLFWSPVKETDKGMKVMEFDCLSLHIWTGQLLFYGNIYIDSENGVYTLTTAGSGIRLVQNADGSVNVVFSDAARYSMENIVKTPGELPNEKCPYDWTSTLTASDIRELSSNFGIDETVLTSPEFIEALADALRSAKKTDFTKETSALAEKTKSILDVHCGEGVYTLIYCDGVVEFSFSESLVRSRYPEVSPGAWRLRCEELNALLESVYYREILPASATDIPAGSPWDWTSTLSIEDIIPGLMAFGSGLDHEKFLADGFAEKLVAALNAVHPDEIYLGRGIPSNSEVTLYTEDGGCTLRCGGGFVEMSFSDALAERYSNDGGIWEIHNEGLTALFESIMAESDDGLRFIYDVNKNPSIRLDFGEYDSLELSYEGGHILFSEDGEGWGDFLGSRVFWEPVEIHWSPMEPVDEENVLARRVDSAEIAFSIQKASKSYDGLINISGEDGVYALTLDGKGLLLASGSNGTAVINVE